MDLTSNFESQKRNKSGSFHHKTLTYFLCRSPLLWHFRTISFLFLFCGKGEKNKSLLKYFQQVAYNLWRCCKNVSKKTIRFYISNTATNTDCLQEWFTLQIIHKCKNFVHFSPQNSQISTHPSSHLIVYSENFSVFFSSFQMIEISILETFEWECLKRKSKYKVSSLEKFVALDFQDWFYISKVKNLHTKEALWFSSSGNKLTCFLGLIWQIYTVLIVLFKKFF